VSEHNAVQTQYSVRVVLRINARCSLDGLELMALSRSGLYITEWADDNDPLTERIWKEMAVLWR
jgi:hypothetical protein